MDHQIIYKIEQSIQQGLTPCIVFDRVSSDKQTDGFSLDYQREMAELYAKHSNLYIVHIFEVSESARTPEERKIFKEMIALSIKHNIKDVVFRCTDRMNRNSQDLHTIEQLIDKDDFKIHFYESRRVISRKSGPDERFMLSIETAVAKHHSDKISHYIKTTNLKKIQMGIAPIPDPPYGYKYDKEKKQHVKDDATRDSIEWIFDTYDSGEMSIRDITDELNTRGIPVKRGRSWAKSTVHSILANIFYTGNFLTKGIEYPGSHEPYITRERYDERIRKMNIKNVSKRNYNLALSGLITTQGRMLTGQIKKNRYVYYTSEYIGVSVREEEIFEKIDGIINSIKFTDDTAQKLEELFVETVNVKKDDSLEVSKSINNEILKLEQENDILLDEIMKGTDPETVRRRTSKNRDKIMRLQARKNKLNFNKEDFVLEVKETIEICKRFPLRYKNADNTGKGDLLKRIAFSYDYDSNKLIFRKPFEYILQIVLACPNMHASLDKARTFVDLYAPEWTERFAA